mgnify:CR=1 FL=1
MRKGNPRRKKISITVDKELDLAVQKYVAMSNSKITKSYCYEQAIKMFLNKDDEVLSKAIVDTIKNSIKMFEDRYCRILAKNCKTTYSLEYLVLNMFAYLCNSENDTKFLLENKEEANKRAYQTLKDGLIERDIDTLFPEEEMKNKAMKK